MCIRDSSTLYEYSVRDDVQCVSDSPPATTCTVTIEGLYPGNTYRLGVGVAPTNFVNKRQYVSSITVDGHEMLSDGTPCYPRGSGQCDRYHECVSDYQVPGDASADGTLVIVTTATEALAMKYDNESLCTVTGTNSSGGLLKTRTWLYPDLSLIHI